jgi:hypothetical protein
MPSLGPIAHVAIAVRRFDEAMVFFDALLDLLGYDLGTVTRGADGLRLIVAISRSACTAVSIREGCPYGLARRLAFRADTRGRVDEACVLVEWLGGEILEGPGSHCGNHYAARFRGPGRLIFEIVHDPAAAGSAAGQSQDPGPLRRGDRLHREP